MSSFLKRYKIHRDGFGFSVIFILVAVLLMKWNIILGIPAVFAALWCLYFFRIPYRKVIVEPGAILSPADGKVVAVQEMVPPSELGLGEGARTRISIFLSIFDAHINNIPISGKVRNIFYKKGRFFHAGKDKASEQNENNSVVIDIDYGKSNDIAIVQIAGLIARRIICEIKEGDKVSASQYYGLIRFGSRVDIYLPINTKSLVNVGDKVFSIETILARI